MLEGTRLDALREEVSRLKLRREGATSERWLLWLGAALAVAGVVLLVGAYSSSHGTRDPLVQQDDVILALLGVSLAVIGSAVFYPMLAISGMFVPLSSMPRSWVLLSSALPMSHAVALLRGTWVGAGWLVLLPHLGALALTIAICLALTARDFRWE